MPQGANSAGQAALRARLDAGLMAMDQGIAEALDDAARTALIGYLGLLERWNRTYNLTAVRDPLQMVPRHLLDSLSVLPWVSRGPVLDLGTGAGLPGIPLAIARPHLAFTLLDSNGKKTRFVRQAALELGLENVEVVQVRLEAYRPERKFATIVARALASLPSLYASAQALATADGRLLALKGPLAADELAALVAAQVPTQAATGPGSPLAGEHRAGAPVGNPVGNPAGTQAGTLTRVQAGPVAEAIERPMSPSAPISATGLEPCIHRLVVPGVDGERSLIEVPLGSSIHG
jgi:16S rRNA (guanine527-N7)-methyltransferase